MPTGTLDNTKRIEINTGYACNNRCIFCSESMHRQEGIQREAATRLTTQVLKDAISGFLEEGYNHLTFLGGEPTIRKDFLDLVHFAKTQGMQRIDLTTNGRMLAKRSFVQALFQAGLSHLTLSLHGHKAAIHDAITQAPGSFKQVTSGIENLQALHLPFRLTTVLCKPNMSELPALMRFSLALKPERLCWSYVRPLGGAFEQFHQVVPLLDELQPELEEALDIAYQHKTKLTVANVPLCRLGPHLGFSDELYWQEKPLWREVEKFVAIHDEQRTEERFRVTPGHHKVKGEECQGCRLEGICDGLSAEYERWMGFDVLRPQAGTPVTKEEVRYSFLADKEDR